MPRAKAVSTWSAWRAPAQHFDHIQLEQPIDGIIPNILGQAGNQKRLIEIAVTHPVGDDKLLTIIKLGFPAIEISLDLEKHTG
ncbi:hypothetical protein D3878_16345 [Noviherbaspirillum sedimenti]|uniref:Uncharacterized protein n=1 Tax=Noviherbaspirillum sedimenti TaxID=2320865 RepID=A0A3A3GL15_9BURK|nr:hypothetical protein D3878_16345 [Noviherbaspirillum sedimenti]